ncbi:hypothetical protein [Pseudoroseomonas cervicalis]|uniref:hypothetical protein n=1 Tax=Teichococcus cervicalis TaxID=204525 RepID=UPI0027878CE0|nr:hypothetical protein [Pseudoroseomonas cervicalis]MDQ1080124.1 hypothetical protein [Pseudoroseomonas cervicalis]
MTMLPRPAARLALLAGLTLLSACAGRADPNQQTFALKSEPAGAECSLQRRGETLATVTTPQQVTVSRSLRDIAVTCRHPGYRDTAATVDSTAIEVTPVHVLGLGMAGIIAHTAAGNFNRYPDESTVFLLPMAFPDAAARDSYLTARRAELDLRAAEVERRIAKSCPTSDVCRMERDKAEAEQQTRVAAIEAQVAAVPVQ